jgi:monovalent cation/proton antiporter MnhG/PhaG subunit
MIDFFYLFFLILGTAVIILVSIALVLMPTIFSKLHYLSIASALGTSSIVFSIFIKEGFTQSGIKALIAGLLIAGLNPLLTHATARARRIRTYGQWQKPRKKRKE